MKVLIVGGAGEVGKHLTETHPCLLGEARNPLYALGKFSRQKSCASFTADSPNSYRIEGPF